MAGRSRLPAALALTGLFLAPLVVMVLGSLRTPGRPPDGFALVPGEVRTANYTTAVRMGDLAGQFGNSLLIIAVAVPVTVLVASWAGFALMTARRARRPLLLVTLIALMVPPFALWVPRVVLLERLGLTDHTVVVALPAIAATTPFYVLVFAFAYSRIPRGQIEAAELEGLSPWRTWSLTFPQARPAAFAVAMLAFTSYWSTVTDPLLLLPSPERWPLSLGLWSLSSLDPPMYPVFLAAAVLATLPPTLVFLLAQRAFLSRTLGVR
ncbi:carbohydrate ABC transporter permease [Actinomadura sp. HBU206391]|uniref:carbohydrate ABC transporter permease n=1 Tax=Actinomadura sp. HBU206391 TaxID=2731692 RepID=UPI001C9BCE28|nr:carbohydrate ABC transporter permease [Actinomadura sp. HBU206391]